MGQLIFLWILWRVVIVAPYGQPGRTHTVCIPEMSFHEEQECRSYEEKGRALLREKNLPKLSNYICLTETINPCPQQSETVR